jgi:hypothetical protein
METRATFFRKLGRWTIGGTLGALCVWVSGGNCERRHPCQDCSAFSGCELPKAFAARPAGDVNK